MRLDDASYAGLRRLVIEKNATAPIDLDVDESGREDRICRKADRCARVGLPKLTPSIRPFEILTDPGPRIVGPIKDVLAQQW